MTPKLRNLFQRFRRRGTRPPGWQDPFIIVGLGNPGPEYRNTRHNVGWWCIDELARRTDARFSRKSPHAELAEVFLRGESVALARPRTFVNESGRAVGYLLQRYGQRYRTRPGRLIVILDDMDLAPGRLRIRGRGSAGGHKGLSSIIAAINTDEFARIRIGVGRPAERGREIDHVLGTIPPDERELVRAAVGRGADAVERILTDGIDRASNEFN